MSILKEVIWVGDSLKNLQDFPESIKDQVGYALHQVQDGKVPRSAKYLIGFKPTVMEIISREESGTYRTAYTVKIADALYVLHCFQKKSTIGIKTSPQDIHLIQQRLKEAEAIDTKRRGY